MQPHHQTGLRAIWRRSTGRRIGKKWTVKKPVAARALREMDLCRRLIESNLRVVKIVEVRREDGDLDLGQPGLTAATLHFLGLLVSNHLEDLLFCLTVILILFKGANKIRKIKIFLRISD